MARAVEIATLIAENSAPLGVRIVPNSAHPADRHGDRAVFEICAPTSPGSSPRPTAPQGVRSSTERRDVVFAGRRPFPQWVAATAAACRPSR